MNIYIFGNFSCTKIIFKRGIIDMFVLYWLGAICPHFVCALENFAIDVFGMSTLVVSVLSIRTDMDDHEARRTKRFHIKLR